MGIWEKELIGFVLKYLVRWFFSNEKNRDAKKELKKKGKGLR